MKISIVIVTWNRCDLVRSTVDLNRVSGGREWDELVWVDNGSTDGTAEMARTQNPDVLVLHRQNQGVSRGYNRAFAMCTGDYIFAIGDRNIQPKNWLNMLTEIAESDQMDACGIWSCDYRLPKERHLSGEEFMLAGHRCFPAIAFESVLFRRSLLTTAGYWREDLGMYGWNDVEWADRLRSRNIRSCVLCDHQVTRAPDISVQMNGEDYRAWREREIHDPAKSEKLEWCRNNNHPYYNPFL